MDRPENLSLRDKIEWIIKELRKLKRRGGGSSSETNPGLALGETASTAYRGDRGKIAYDHSQVTGNPHNTTKSEIGLGNVDNTSDANKPISNATQTALDLKADLAYVNNIQIGGRNLIINSTNDDTILLYGATATRENIVDATLPSKNYFKFTNVVRTIGNYVFHIPTRNKPDKFSQSLIGKKIQISFYIRSNNSQKLVFDRDGNQNFMIDSTWQKVRFNNVFNGGNLHFNLEGSGLTSFDISSVKIEFGDKATDWTPAPEDKQDRLQNVTGKIGVGKTDASATEKLDVNGRVKSKGKVFEEDSATILPKEIKFQDGDFYVAGNDGIRKKILREGDVDFTGLIHRYVHSGNQVLVPTAIDYTTGYITVVNHGQSFSGKKPCGLFKRGLVSANSDPNNDFTGSYPDEYMATQTYVKVIDTNTLMICNSAGAVIPVNTGGPYNKALDINGWQLEIFSSATFNFPTISADKFSVIIYGYSSGLSREFMLHKDSSSNGMFYAVSGTPTRKNNIISLIFATFIKSGNFKVVHGTESGRYRMFANNNYTYNLQVNPSFLNFSPMSSTTINTFSWAFAGGSNQPFPFCNGSVIEIYKS